jgi:predicted N-acyltransferase
MKNTGVRFTITNLHTFSQIESMLHAFASHFHHILQEENMNQAAIYREFKIPAPLEQKVYHILNAIEKRSQLRVIHTQSILDIPKTEWDNLFTCSVTYNWDGLALLEASFQGNPLPESNWDFDYIIIKDEAGKVVLATSLSTSLCKDDMLAPAAVSRQIEDKRQHNNSYYLTSKLISTGNLLSGGKHLYIDKASPLWKDAFELLLEKIALLQIKYDANTVLLRDFQSNDIEMDLFLSDNAYFKITMPDNHEVNNLNWESREEYISVLSQFSKRTKRYIKQDVFRHMEKFEVQWVTAPSKEEIQYLYELYLDVNKKSYELNTFVLPFRLFENIAQNKNWEIMTLRLKPEYDNREECRPVAVTFSFINGKHYHFMLVGLDYKFQKEHKCYKQAIYRLLERAKELNLETVNLGFTASHAKQMTFAAQPIHSVGYMYAKDTYSMEVISSTHIMETAN